MSNLLKAYSVVCHSEGDKRIIDSNQAVGYAIDKIRQELESEQIYDVQETQTGFVQGLNVENVEGLLYSENDQDGLTVVSGNTIIADDEEAEAAARNIISQAEEKARNLLSNADGDAAAIIEKAKAEAERIYEDARRQGYEAGYGEGRQNLEAEYNAKHNELQALRDQLMEEYEAKKKNMEPELVDAILQVFIKVTHVLSEDKKDLIIDLVDSVMSKNPLSNNFFIRTSKEDAEFLRTNKDRLRTGINKNLNLDIIEDSTMKRNECLIETDFGVFDCSLDIQLDSLVRDIKLLACAVGNE